MIDDIIMTVNELLLSACITCAFGFINGFMYHIDIIL